MHGWEAAGAHLARPRSNGVSAPPPPSALSRGLRAAAKTSARCRMLPLNGSVKQRTKRKASEEKATMGRYWET